MKKICLRSKNLLEVQKLKKQKGQSVKLTFILFWRNCNFGQNCCPHPRKRTIVVGGTQGQVLFRQEIHVKELRCLVEILFY